MVSLKCFWVRRRIAAHLDGALAEKRAEAVAAHVGGCAGCQEERSRLERLRGFLRATLSAGADPDWSGFWDGVRRRILAERPAPRREAWWGGLWRQVAGYPRLALGGALAGLVLLALTLWPSEPPQAPIPKPGVVLSAVETAQADGHLMVFTNPEDEMTVIWLFGSDQAGDQSRIRPVSMTGG